MPIPGGAVAHRATFRPTPIETTGEDKMTIQKLGTLVFDTIGELFHRGETRLDPDNAEAIELRKMAYRAVGVKTDGDPLLVSGRELGYSVLEWLQGLGDFRAVRAASQTYEKQRIS
jgi:hypothetical protein